MVCGEAVWKQLVMIFGMADWQHKHQKMEVYQVLRRHPQWDATCFGDEFPEHASATQLPFLDQFHMQQLS